MSAFDIAASVDENSMNRAIANIYNRVYPAIFKGGQEIAGKSLEWDVKEAPAFDLSPVSDLRQTALDHFAAHKFQAAGGLTHDDLADAFEQSLGPSSFTLTFPKVALSFDNKSIEAGLAVICTITTENGILKLHGAKASFLGKEATGWNKLILTAILDAVLAIATHMLNGVDIPHISFDGVTLTAPTVSVQQNRIVTFFNLAGKGQPPAAQMSWPGDPFFVMLSDDAKDAIGSAATAGLEKPMTKSGSVGSSIGGASYQANATVRDIRVSSAGQGSPDYEFSSTVSGSVDAKVKFMCVPVGVSYELYAKPNPTGTISIGISGTTLSATTQQVNPFVIVLSPSGNIVEKVITAITQPILQAVSAVFTPVISAFLKGIQFDLTTLPIIPVSIGGQTLTLTPGNLSLSSVDGYLTAGGTLDLS